MKPDTYVYIDGETMTLSEANDRYGTASFPTPIIGNCFRMSDYLRIPFIPPLGLISDGILPMKAKMLMFGEPKTGKSFSAMQLGHSVAERLPWCGFEPHPNPNYQPSVYYIQTEISESEFKERLSLLCPSDNFYVETMHGQMLLGENVSVLANRLERIKPDLLILDPLYMLMDGDLNSSVHMGLVHRNIDMLIENFDCSVLVVHHTRKPNAENKGGLMEALGSITITAFYDSILFLEREDNYNYMHFTLRHNKSPEPIPMLQLDNGLFQALNPLHYLTDTFREVNEICLDMKLPSTHLPTIITILNSFASRGLIAKTTNRQYRRLL